MSRRCEAVFAAMLVALAGCQARDGAVHPAANGLDAGRDGSTVTITIGGDASADESHAATAPLGWQDAVRLGKWQDAEAAFAKLPPNEQSAPEVRFARARVALARGKHADVAPLLDKLEDDLPLMRELIARTRAQAALAVGPYDKAAEYYGSKPGPAASLLAAEAWEKAGEQPKARAACDHVIAADKRTHAQEEKARAMRMRLVALKDGDAAAAPDARWLAIHGLDDKVVAEARELLGKVSPPKPLTADELMLRAHALADAMRPDDALKAIERAAGAGRALSAEDQCRARAEAFFKARTRYPEAAAAYQKCVTLGGPRAPEYAFLAARSWSRADRDTDALPAFEKVIQRWPRAPWADEAEFHLARTHYLAGRWRDAANAFDTYVRRWPAGKDRREADRYRALAHLLARDDKLARKLLEELAGTGDDLVMQARWTNLAALAALRDGDRTHAIARWTWVAKTRPLSWPALVARARLLAASAPIPPAIDPTEPGAAPPETTIELPAPADTLHRIGFDADAEDALRERESAILAKSVGRGTEALCAAYAAVDRAKRRYQLALQIPAQAFATAPGPRNRWAWECAFPRPYRAHVRAHEASAKLPENLLWAVMRQESAFDPEVVSPARAVGLLQLLPETARTVAKQANLEHDDAMLTLPEHNIALGALYLRELLDDLDGIVPLAVASYNAGPDAIKRWLSKASGATLDVFVEAIPFLETRGYVVRVMGNLARYGYLERGDAGVPVVALDLEKR